MKSERKGLKAMFLALTGCVCGLTANAETEPKSQTLYALGSQQTFAGPEDLFTGKVSVDMMFPQNEHTAFSGAYVTFAPGARTNWHTHPAGQHMIVTKGIALTGTRDGHIHQFSAGETVWCPPDLDHWHGASPHAAMTHLVMTGSKDGENVVWKEKVTDEQYLSQDSEPVIHSLDNKHQAIVPIAAYTANGDQVSLKVAIIKGLEAGLTVNEIKEVQVHLYAYTGFPRALNAIATFMAVLEERKQAGIMDPIGEAPTAIPEGESSLEIGTKVQTELVGFPVTGGMFDFAPGMNTFLQSHLFGDIFARGVLDFAQREMVTVSALASLDGAESQLRSHIRMATNTGVTEAQLADIGKVLGMRVGKTEALRVHQAIDQVLNTK